MARGESLALLSTGKIPERYQRNLGTIGYEGQMKLLRAKVLVVGAGGLGGTAIELLARHGVGQLRVVDGDTFAQHNLNRQLLASECNIGLNKAMEAVERVAKINSDVTVEAIPGMMNEDNVETLLKGIDVVVDALDRFSTRLLLWKTAEKLGIPLVHAAIAGFTGRVMTVFPGDIGLEMLLGKGTASDQGIETSLGNPSSTPALAAALQVQEVVKILTGIGEPLRDKWLYFDTEVNVFEVWNMK